MNTKGENGNTSTTNVWLHLGNGAAAATNDKRGGGGMVPRCQVEGCHVALVNAKEYHRRHRVCDMHSKAPKVLLLGFHQRFCQQCSRFHIMSEFDDSKRSCRRRLAGHNERRRKNSHLSTRQACALSLLSSGSGNGSDYNWVLSPHHADFSTRCSAALRELIAENRSAALMTRQQVPPQQQQQQQQQLAYDNSRDHWYHHHHHAAALVLEQDFEEQQQPQPESNYFPTQMFPQTQ